MVHNPELSRLLRTTTETARRGELPVVVFDVDSTLFDTALRHLRILTEFAHDHPEHGLIDRVATYTPHDMHWDVWHPLLQDGLGLSGEVKEALFEYWWDRFFSDEYCRIDLPVPGAVSLVRGLHDRGAMIYYLTARPVDTMGPGTLASFERWGLPVLVGRTILQLKPSSHTDDASYKHDAMEDIAALRGTVVGTFENEPGHANMFAETWPEAQHFLMDMGHSHGAPAPRDDLIVLKDLRVEPGA